MQVYVIVKRLSQHITPLGFFLLPACKVVVKIVGKQLFAQMLLQTFLNKNLEFFLLQKTFKTLHTFQNNIIFHCLLRNTLSRPAKNTYNLPTSLTEFFGSTLSKLIMNWKFSSIILPATFVFVETEQRLSYYVREKWE